MIVAQLATIPGREGSVKQTIESLEMQVDLLHVRYKSPSDAEKFRDLDKYDGYIFTCDDDLIYPPNYVRTMIAAIERNNRKAVITCHGRTFPPRKIRSYYRDKTEGYRCLGTVDKDYYVHSGGTGVMAWHSDLWRPQMDWFKAPNMADVFIGREAHVRGIPIVCIAHKEGWIRYIDQPEGTTIWEQHVNDDTEQTRYWNEYWFND